ncbi:WD40 repeat-like protein [Penicillium herquei]|nr:WD40 repeat-like protein [Penicillium herquei]
MSSQTMVIVIDALDECEGDADIRLILQLLPQLKHLNAIRLRVTLTSRPDLPVRLGFSKIASEDYTDLILHDIPEEVIEHDIALFFKHQLAEIRTERFLPTDWPGDRRLSKINNNIHSFIHLCSHYLSTYLPVLDRLLHRQHGKQKNRLISEFQQVIGSIVVLQSPLSTLSLSKLLDLPADLIQLRLDALQSVVRVPVNETIPIRLFHLSFRDFLLDPETAQKTPFWINEAELHYIVAKQCLWMCHNLRRNICELSSVGTQRIEIELETIEKCIAPELQYACKYWVYHLVRCKDFESIVCRAFLFLRSHFLHWVEAMSLLGLASDVLVIIRDLQKVVSGNHGSTDDLDFLHDAKRFMLKNHPIADRAPLQVYSAGLVFAPSKTIIRRHFEGELPAWISQLPQVDPEWGAELQVLEGHSDSINSVVFSPDSRLLASGSDDGTVCLWDPMIGRLTQTLNYHPYLGINSIVFSPDSHILASGADDGTVCLWDSATGTVIWSLTGKRRIGAVNSVYLWDPVKGRLKRILKGHSASVQSVSFSPDGRLLASGSEDTTIRVWNPVMGTLIHTLRGHSEDVVSVAFSPNSRLLASIESETIYLWDPVTGALTRTLQTWLGFSVAFSPTGRLLASSSIEIWDLETRTVIQTLKGHSDAILSVAFSPDGCQLASSSMDCKLRLWDLAVGASMQTCPSRAVWSLTFSPDGRVLASGSTYGLSLWDPKTGIPTQTLEGHSKEVWSLNFSPDGHLLASDSDDGIVRLWGPKTGILMQIFQGHSEKVCSLAFSPDSRLLASGSSDNMVRLWDPATGELILNLEGPSYDIRSFSFSPDGHLLASVSYDMTVCLWDPATGALMHSLKHELGLKSPYSVTFSCTGRLLVCDSDSRTVCLWNPATSALVENLEDHSDVVLSMVFNKSHSHNSLDSELSCNIPASSSPHMCLDIFIEHNQWIKVNGERKLWLPDEFRPGEGSPECFKVYGNIVALGHASGRVSFIGFTCEHAESEMQP